MSLAKGLFVMMRRYTAATNSDFPIWILLFGLIPLSIIALNFDFRAILIVFGCLMMALFSVVMKKAHVAEYLIMGEYLIVRAAFINKTIPIKSIRKIMKNNSIMRTKVDNATAPAQRALELIYNNCDSILVSPDKREEFIADLLRINPSIEVKL